MKSSNKKDCELLNEITEICDQYSDAYDSNEFIVSSLLKLLDDDCDWTDEKSHGAYLVSRQIREQLRETKARLEKLHKRVRRQRNI